MNGSPIDLTPFGSVLTGLGVLYWLVAAGALFAALRYPETCRGKWIAALVILVVFGYLPASDGLRAFQAQRRLKEAITRFDIRCKTAAEKVIRTVEKVDGVVWMKWRPKVVNLSDQFMLNDPYGHDCYGEECLKRLLRVTKGAQLSPEDAKQHATGYNFVETIDPSDGKHYRYTAAIKSIAVRTPDEIEQYKKNSSGRDPGADVYGFALERESIDNFTARYGITWDDLSTHEDREQWIAGSSLRVIDLQANEVIAQRIGYMLDRGLGSQADFRSPWPLAQRTACPAITSERTTWAFAMKVLHPNNHGE